MPAADVALGAISGRTTRIRLGSAVTVLSSDDPVRVFQHYSTRDAVPVGRAEVILGRRVSTLAPLEDRALGEARVNKSQLVEQVAKDTGLSRSDARRAVESVIATVQKALKKGEDVSLTGFGRFSVVKRAARTGRNPRTGEPLHIRAGKAARFTPGAGLKRAVAGRRRK
jgi:DNA-binding protein HU-beta